MKKIVIQELSSKETKEHNGKKYAQVGLKADGKWLNGTMWEGDISRFGRLKVGDEIIIDEFTEEYKGKLYEKFKLPSAFQEISYKLDLIINLLSVPEDKPSKEKPDFPEEEPDLPF